MMPLATDLIDIPLGVGLAENVSSKLIQPGSFAELENVVINRGGELQKRNGYSAHPVSVLGGGSLPNVDGLDVLGSELLAYGTNATDQTPHVYSYSEATSGWVDVDSVCPATSTRKSVMRSNVFTMAPSVVCASGYYVFVWLYLVSDTPLTFGIRIKCIDQVTGAVAYEDTSLNTLLAVATSISVIACNDIVVVTYCDGTNIKFKRFDTSTLTHATYTGPACTVQVFDTYRISDTKFALSWCDTAPAPDALKTSIFDITTMTGLTPVSVSGTGADTFTAVAVCAQEGNVIAVSYYIDRAASDDQVEVVCYNATTLASVWGPTELANASDTTISARFDGITNVLDYTGQVVTVWRDGTDANNDENRSYKRTVDISGVVTGATKSAPHVSLFTRPFLSEQRLYAIAQPTLVSGDTLVCVDSPSSAVAFELCGTPALVSRVETSSVIGFAHSSIPSRNAVTDDSGKIVYACYILSGGGDVGGGTVYTGIDLVSLDFAAQQASLRKSTIAQYCLISSGCLSAKYDSQGCVEIGFVAPPVVLDAAVNAAAGGGLTSGFNYLYAAHYEYVDAKGNVERSSVSPIETVAVSGASPSVTLKVSCIALTRKGDSTDGVGRNPRIVLYRSLAGGTDFYRLDAAIENDRTAPYITYEDKFADSDISGKSRLYTDGGALDNDIPGPSSHCCLHKNRVFLVSSSFDKSVLYSKSLLFEEAPAFSPAAFRVDVDSPDGVVAVASVGESLAIFTASRIYQIYGDGPNDTASGVFSEPALVSREAGCVDARSVASFDGGAVFRGKAGFYLLSKQLQVSFIGAPIQDTAKTYSETLSAVVDAANQRIYWLVRSGAPDTIWIVWDYYHNAWYTWKTEKSDSMSAQCIWNDSHVWASEDSVFAGDDVLKDDHAWVTTKVTTPWVKVGSIAGFQRVRYMNFILDISEYSNVIVDVFRNFEALPNQTATFDLGANSQVEAASTARLRRGINLQRCNAIKLRYTDEQGELGGGGETELPVTDAGGTRISGLSLELGVVRGSQRVSSTNRGTELWDFGTLLGLPQTRQRVALLAQDTA